MSPATAGPLAWVLRNATLLRLQLLIAAVVVVSAGVIAYVQVAVTRIEENLPLRVMQEKRDMELAARDFYYLLAAIDGARAVPSPDKVAGLGEELDALDRDLEELRERYTFDTLIGASALHAALYPVVEDLRSWLTEGFGTVPPASPIVLELAGTRARGALDKVYEKTAEADRIAYEILERQSAELLRLRSRLVFVLAVFALLAGSVIWLAVRQQRASRGREQAEAERSRAQARLSDALESASEGFAFFDLAERLVTCNTRYREFFLRDLRDVVVPGASIGAILQAAADRAVVNDAAADPESWAAQRLARFRDPRGAFAQQFRDGRWVQINERRTADGGTVAVYADITELKRREMELLEAKEGAEGASRAKSAFLANVSHELRTPLTSIMGFTRIIQRRLEELIFPRVRSDEARVARAMRQVAENLEIMLLEGRRLTTMVNNVLDLEKIEAGATVWNVEPLCVADLIGQAAAATESLYAQKGLEFVVDAPADLPTALGDRDRIVQVIVNLISNAVKFTEKGGIRCSVAVEDGRWVRVEVADTGCGIAPDDHAAVFEKFRQVGDTLTEKPTGTGLGLPICKEIVEHLGGWIALESEPGRGSKFRFALPVAKGEAGREAQAGG